MIVATPWINVSGHVSTALQLSQEFVTSNLKEISIVSKKKPNIARLTAPYFKKKFRHIKGSIKEENYRWDKIYRIECDEDKIGKK